LLKHYLIIKNSMEEKEVVNGAILELDDRDWIAG
jgi:hypothetical protein